MNLSILTKWLADHHTKFRAEIQPVKNVLIKMFAKNTVRFINNQVIRSRMMISYADMEQLVSSMENDDYSLCWNLNES